MTEETPKKELSEKTLATLAKGQEALRKHKLGVAETKHVHGASLWDFLNEFHAAVLDGWELSSKSQYFPVARLGHYAVVLVKYNPEVEKVPKEVPPIIQKVIEEKGEQVNEAWKSLPPEPKKRGPKAKSA